MSTQQIAHVARRIPMIKFTHGKRFPTPQVVQQPVAVKPVVATQEPVKSQKGVFVTRVDQFYQLPKKYLRKKISNEEMDAINRGGF